MQTFRRIAAWTITAAALATASAYPAVAQTNGNKILYAKATCGQYLNAIERKDRATSEGIEMWLAGYFTAVNLSVPNVDDILAPGDFPGAVYWVRNWCRANPLGDMVGAAMRLFVEQADKLGR